MLRQLLALTLVSTLWSTAAMAAEVPDPVPAPIPAALSSSMFDSALETLAAGDLRRGCTLLQQLAAPTSPDRQRATQLARIINGLDPQACSWVEGSVDISTDGRVELIVSQGLLAPIWFGTLLPVYIPDSVTAASTGGMVLAGLGVGIAVPYALTRENSVTSGQALTIYTAELLGGWYGVWLEGALTDEVTGRPGHLGVLAGLGAGIGLANAFPQVSAGDVALMRSGALWGTGYGGIVLSYLDGPDPRGAFAILGTGTTVGLAAAGALSRPLELRRSQVNLINLGGYVGLLTAGGLLLMAQPDDSRVIATSLGVGATAGLVIGSHLATRNGDGVLARTRLPPAGFAMLKDANGKSHPGIVLNGRW